MRHPGEVAVRRRAGVDADDWGSASVGGTVPDVAADFLAAQRMVVVAGRADGEIWSTVLTGDPGFAVVEDPSTLVVGASLPAADPLSGSFASEEEVGMLAIDPATRRRMRVNGRARTTGAGLQVTTEQVYSNCPKYIQTRRIVGDDLPVAPVRSDSTTLTDAQQAWLAGADTFFVGTGAPGHGLDVSHRGGSPGFVEATATHLRWPDYVGNSMYMTLGNTLLDPRAGLLVVDWAAGRTLHVAGRMRVDWDADRTARRPGAQRLVELDVTRVVELEHRLPFRWHLEKYSTFNPPVRGV